MRALIDTSETSPLDPGSVESSAARENRHTPFRGAVGWRLFAALVTAVLAAAGLAAGITWWATRPSHHGGNAAMLAAHAITAGVAAQSRGDLNSAATDYKQALDHEPKNTQALYDLGVDYYAQDNVGLAAAQYRKVLAINARYEPALYNLAIIAQNQGNTAQSLSLYQQAVRAAPGDPRAHFNLALILRTMPKYKSDGDAQMKIAMKLDPTLHDPAARH